VSLLGSPHGAQALGRQDATCVLACLASKPKPPSCTCISETAPSHLKTRSHTPHRRGTGLCAAARPPAGSRQACRPAGTLPACPARRRGCRPVSRRRNTSGVAGERKQSQHTRCTGAQGHLPGLVGPVTLQRLHFQLPKVHMMPSPSAAAALSEAKMPEAPAAGWNLGRLRTAWLQWGGTALPHRSLGSMPASGARTPRTLARQAGTGAWGAQCSPACTHLLRRTRRSSERRWESQPRPAQQRNCKHSANIAPLPAHAQPRCIRLWRNGAGGMNRG